MNIISKGGVRVPKRYVPKHLSKKDKKKQAKELKKSRKAYKRGKYYQRKKVKSFKRKESSHIKKAKKMYKVKSLKINKSLARKTGCKTRGLRKIVAKGKGAYYSSGSRPNQTAHSWGYARLGSSITGGKASAVDYNILKKYCSKKSKALKLASKMKGKGTRRVKKVKIGGKQVNWKRMGEREQTLNAKERRRILRTQTANDDNMQRRIREWQNAYDAVRWLEQQEERFQRIDRDIRSGRFVENGHWQFFTNEELTPEESITLERMYAPFIEEQRERYFNWLEMNAERNINRTNNDIEEPRRQRRRREQEGGKRYKKCLGKKNGIDGCRKCCNKKYTRRSYKKCVKKCMKHKPRK